MTEDKIYQQIEKDIDQLALHLGRELSTYIDEMLVKYQSNEEREKDPSLEFLDKECYTKYVKENATIVWLLKRMAMAEVIQKYNNEQQGKIVVILEQIRAQVFKLPLETPTTHDALKTENKITEETLPAL